MDKTVIAKFIFTSLKNSFSVHVPNLEKLSVKQIKDIEDFVNARNGVFDFNSYSFVIQKRLSFNDFMHLIKSCGIKADFEEKVYTDNNTKKVEFGKYKGMLYSEIPNNYLIWLKKNYIGKDIDIIDKELKKRDI